MAVDGLDLRNIDLSLTLTPKTSNVKIKEYIGKTVLTGIGFGATWGSRRLRFKASNVIATIDIPWQRHTVRLRNAASTGGSEKTSSMF